MDLIRTEADRHLLKHLQKLVAEDCPYLWQAIDDGLSDVSVRRFEQAGLLQRTGNGDYNIVIAALERLTADPPEQPAATSPNSAQARNSPGDGEALLRAHLRKHHEWRNGSPPTVDVCHPVSPSKELAKKLGIATGTVSAFFTRWFEGRRRYDAICRREDRASLAATIQLMSGEITPRELRKALEDRE